MLERLRFGFRLYILPATKCGAVVLIVSSLVGVASGRNYGRSILEGAVAGILATIFLVIKSLRHDEEIAAVEAYQSHAYYVHLKIASALTKLHNVLDLCHHGDLSTEHRHCVAAMRRQTLVIRAALGGGTITTLSKAKDPHLMQSYAAILREVSKH